MVEGRNLKIMKYDRHAKILEIAEKLKELGMEITQATVSRDIKELRLTKMLQNGRYKYSSVIDSKENISNKLITIFNEAYIYSDYANNMVVVKTLPGMAQAGASAIDSLNWEDILGTIAGDDTIMIVCRAEKVAEKLVKEFSKQKL